MANNPQYASTPKIGIGQLSVANALRDGTGTLATVFSSDGALGSRIDSIEIQATGTTTAGMVRLFIHDGTSAWLFAEIPVTAATPAATTPAWFAISVTQFGSPSGMVALPIVLPQGYSLRASTQNAEPFNVLAFGGSF